MRTENRIRSGLNAGEGFLVDLALLLGAEFATGGLLGGGGDEASELAFEVGGNLRAFGSGGCFGPSGIVVLFFIPAFTALFKSSPVFLV
jgi:hypothetical protein